MAIEDTSNKCLTTHRNLRMLPMVPSTLDNEFRASLNFLSPKIICNHVKGQFTNFNAGRTFGQKSLQLIILLSNNKKHISSPLFDAGTNGPACRVIQASKHSIRLYQSRT